MVLALKTRKPTEVKQGIYPVDPQTWSQFWWEINAAWTGRCRLVTQSWSPAPSKVGGARYRRCPLGPRLHLPSSLPARPPPTPLHGSTQLLSCKPRRQPGVSRSALRQHIQ